MERLCVFCAHFDLTLGDHGYSEYTPGYSGRMTCLKNHFDIDSDKFGDDYREIIKRAISCPDFEPYKSEI